MNFHIDIPTGILVLIIGHFFSGVLGIAYRMQNKSDTVIYTFLFSRLFDLIAWVFIGLRVYIGDVLSILVGNSFLIIGTTLQIKAFLTIKDSYGVTVRRVHIILSAVFVGIINVVSLVFQQESIRVAFMSLFIVMLWIYPSYVLLMDKKVSILQKVIAVIYAAGFIPHLSNILWGSGELLTGQTTGGTVQNAIFFIMLYIVMLVGNMGVILLAKEKVDLGIVKAATYDDLTGIYNRRTFLSFAEEKLVQHIKRKQSFGVLIMDLDNFKGINDRYGHFVGDLVLKNFAVTVKSVLRQDDIFGRFGGEEFSLLMPQTDLHQAAEIAEKIRVAVENAVVKDTIHYTVSIGVSAEVPDEATTYDILSKKSDKALYAAKNGGRNRVAVAPVG